MKTQTKDILSQFINPSQLSVVRLAMNGEEKQLFIDKMEELRQVIQKMPKTGGTDGQGDNAVVYLHYFLGGADWYILEKDMENEQHQAFGLADLFQDGGELGYISIVELIENGVELDFHWTPKSLAEVRKN